LDETKLKLFFSFVSILLQLCGHFNTSNMAVIMASEIVEAGMRYKDYGRLPR